MTQLWVPGKKKISRDFSSCFKPVLSNPQSDIYVSKDFLDNENKLLCLIQGTGRVKAG